jgi:lipopolysaccharide transport system ATP-binding protein
MPDPSLQVQHVFKKFRRGEHHDSLRDLIPAIAGKLMRREHRQSLDNQEFWALQDVSFEVERGEAFGIIGSNGAGKSTILKLLSSIMKPTAGVIRVNGRLSALIEISAGFHPDLTGRENIYLNGTILGLKTAEIRRRFDEIVAFSGLEEFIDTPVKRYSSGMHARLGFSVAAHVDPDILVVDEVLSVGDLAFQRKCLDRMHAVLKGGATVVFISHNLETVVRLCTRSLLLERGRIVKIGPSEEVVRVYLAMGEWRRDLHLSQEAFIAKVEVRGRNGPQTHFQSGEKGYIDVEVVGNGVCERVAVVIAIGTANVVVVFNTSTEWLGVEPFSLGKGQRVTCTFALDLHLATGEYYVSTWIYRDDIDKRYDAWDSARTFFVAADRDNKGVANLYPELRIATVEGVDDATTQDSPHSSRSADA